MAANNSEFPYNNNSSGGGGGGGAMSHSSSGSGGGYYDHLINPVGGNYYNSPATGGTLNDGGILNNNSLLDAGLKHDTGLAVEWSVDEQYKLEQGLAKYASEPNIMRYIKIAASLQDKTVRDVAIRCRWMARKRRKPEDQNLGKKVKDNCKDKLMESTLKNTMPSASSVHVPAYSLTTNHHRPSDYMLSGVLSCTARHLLEENYLAFGRISANLSTLKLQENIDLFSHTRDNITTLLNDMRNMPGIMSRMPPLPVLLNEDLASRIFPHSSQLLTLLRLSIKFHWSYSGPFLAAQHLVHT